MDTMLSPNLSILPLLLPLPFKLNSVRSGTCWNRRAAEKHEEGDGPKARYGANTSRVRKRPAVTEF